MFANKMTREEFLDRYEKEKTRSIAESGLRAFDFYRERKWNNISEENYIKELIKTEESQLYLELNRLVS